MSSRELMGLFPSSSSSYAVSQPQLQPSRQSHSVNGAPIVASDPTDVKLILPLLKKIAKRSECEYFREPFNYSEVGFFDYPLIIQQPIAISVVVANVDSSSNSNKPIPYSIDSMLKDTRLIWRNAMVYNSPGTHVYNAAKTLSSYWESQWVLIFPHHIDVDEDRPPRKDDIKHLIDLLQDMDSSQLAALIMYLDTNSPMCLFKHIDTKEIQINIDLIGTTVCHNIFSSFRRTDGSTSK